MESIKTFLKQIFTEVDNSTFDLTKILAMISILSAVGLAIFSVVYHNQTFDMQNYGLGTSALFAGVGVALGMKKDS
jgi:sensor histidine kinase regulating citrate/malate metabolism